MLLCGVLGIALGAAALLGWAVSVLGVAAVGAVAVLGAIADGVALSWLAVWAGFGALWRLFLALPVVALAELSVAVALPWSAAVAVVAVDPLAPASGLLPAILD